MSRRAHPRLRAFSTLLLVAVPMAGRLTAAMLAPWVVGPGLAARSSANLLTPLPGGLADETPAGQHRRPGRRRLADHLVLPAQPDAGRVRPDRGGDEAGAGRHRGLAVLRAPRARHRGHGPRPGAQRRRRRGDGGRLDHHPATGEADPAAGGHHRGGTRGGHRVQRRPQAARGPAGPGPGGAVHEVGDPHPLPEPRLLRRGRLRRPGRRPALLQRQRRRPHAAAGGHARRSGADAVERRPAHRPGTGPPAAQPGAAADARLSGTSPRRDVAAIEPTPVAVVPSPPPPNGCVNAVQGGVLLRLPAHLPDPDPRHRPGR